METIAALATPPGRGGVAIVRVSGPQVKNIIQKLLHADLQPRVATYLSFYDDDHAILDNGIAIYFPAPHSFTGEEVLELQGHGGPIVVDLLLQTLLKLGARLARPGEFSERAFLNGKMDLVQAEAIADLINAASTQAARSALRSLQGEFSAEINALNKRIIHLRMYIEAAIDFTDEEINFLSDANIHAQLDEILQTFMLIETKAKQGSLLREGITAVIVGAPNVGKSSLLNALSGKETAIVTDIPGTTRDVLRDYILLDGMPVHIIDTAGLRTSTDIVEQEGIKRAYQEMQKADVLLYMQDVHHLDVEIDLPLLNCPIIFIHNKIDLIGASPTFVQQDKNAVITISVKKNLGLDLLKNHIKSLVGYTAEESIYLARRRHSQALAQANLHLQLAKQQLLTSPQAELIAEELRLAQRALGEITGEFSVDDLLGEIFSNFCVGK